MSHDVLWREVVLIRGSGFGPQTHANGRDGNAACGRRFRGEAKDAGRGEPDCRSCRRIMARVLGLPVYGAAS